MNVQVKPGVGPQNGRGEGSKSAEDCIHVASENGVEASDLRTLLPFFPDDVEGDLQGFSEMGGPCWHGGCQWGVPSGAIQSLPHRLADRLEPLCPPPRPFPRQAQDLPARDERASAAVCGCGHSAWKVDPADATESVGRACLSQLLACLLELAAESEDSAVVSVSVDEAAVDDVGHSSSESSSLEVRIRGSSSASASTVPCMLVDGGEGWARGGKFRRD